MKRSYLFLLRPIKSKIPCTLLCAICLSLISCNHRSYCVQFLTEDATEIKQGTDVRIRGMKIGKVDNLNLFSNQYIIISLRIDEKFKLPKKSEFKIKPIDFAGNKFISVNMSDEQEFIADNDTVYEAKDTMGVQNFGVNEINPDSLAKAINLTIRDIKETFKQQQ